MLFRSPPDSLRATDARLHPFLLARTDAEAKRRLDAVFKEHIRPTCEAILKPRFSAYMRDDSNAGRQEDMEDVGNTVIAVMLSRLQAMRQEYLATRGITKPIQDARRYTAMVTFNAWKGYLRERYPVYHQVYRCIRTLLTDQKANASLPPMAVWEEAQSNGRKIRVGGLVSWRDQKRPRAYSDRLLALLLNPKAAMAEAWTHAQQSAPLEVGDPLSHDGLYVIFAWANHPVELNNLTQLLCEATDRLDTPPLPLEAGGKIPGPMGEESAAAFMQMLWECVRPKMTERELAVWLLGGKDSNDGSLLHWMVEEDIASHRDIAEAMGMPIPTLMNLWKSLPLADDEGIAKVLLYAVQSVRDARYDGRIKLRKCLAETLLDDL